MELLCGVDAASNGSSLVDFVHHVKGSVNWPILFHSVDWIGLLREAALARHAVSAGHKVTALQPVGPALGLVDAAGFFCHVVLVHELVGEQVVSSLAALVSLLVVARQQHLGSNIDICLKSGNSR